MLFIRRQLNAWSITWLLCQVASLAALLPPECCAAHSATAASTEECHKAPEAGAACPMHADMGAATHDATGQPCPMHTESGASSAAALDGKTDQSSTGAAARECSMRGMCNGPAVALGSLFAIPGILLDPPSAHVEPSASALSLDVAHLPALLLSFDTPPPRS